MTKPQATGTDLLKTVAACILAPLTAAVAAAVAGVLWYLMNAAFTVIRPEIIGFIAASIGALVGMYAARAACDKLLSGYLPQAVFLVFAIIVAFSVYMYVFLLPFAWGNLASYAQVAIIGCMAYILFWKFEPI